MSATSMRDRLAFTTSQLAEIDPGGHPGRPKGVKSKDLVTDGETIAGLQERLWAESRDGGTRSLLLVLQGIDTAGKGGVTEHVVGACGPIGVQYSSFGKPTPEELEHDFLWRIRKRLPPAGVIGVFDRSHYEDVLVARVHDLALPEVIEERYAQINDFEQALVDGGTTVLKVFLHISFDTQRERLLARLDNPNKHWKFHESDLTERARWADYQAAFQVMLERCNSAAAPWYVVPADH
ncbi:PPK2 family polyphosphate kinase, partial [Jatrophihabitans sp.]|uniref:PPK2 family polyphosphate kinase n=1 Tax=Jatrophihabitans sp. TaxID=1932789 RepID=UPI0030C6DE4A|nr:polyphosphate kinase 2 family protein [Jatrophihabitans sp.]